MHNVNRESTRFSGIVLPDHVLFDLFECAYSFGPKYDSDWKPAPPPTDEDVARVEEQLETRLPPLLVKLAGSSPYYERAFPVLGDPDNYSATSLRHIVAVNEFWQEEGKPKDFIMISYGYDGVCDFFRRQDDPTFSSTPIEYVNIHEGELSNFKVLADNFRCYLQDLCVHSGPRSRSKSLRKKAKKILAEWT